MSPPEPVPVDAVSALLTLWRAHGVEPQRGWVEALVAPAIAAEHARAFKLDVSVDLGADPAPRLSVNDTGEPDAFRARIVEAAPSLGIDPALLVRFFGASSPGDGQTTVALKWERGGLRTSLYIEELARHSDPAGCRARVRALAGMPSTPEGGPGVLGAVAIDLSAGALVGFKEYRQVALPMSGLPGDLAAFADLVPAHPRTGEKKALLAARHGPDGACRGHKLLWMTEARSPREATWAWTEADRIAARLGERAPALIAGPNRRRALRLASKWPRGLRCVAYPDLISLDVDAAGHARRLLWYVSIK